MSAACSVSAVASAQAPERHAELIEDASQRTSLLRASTAGKAGHDGRFFFESDDGERRLHVGGYGQIRYHLNAADAGPDQDGFESGFQVERVRLVLSGRLRDGTSFLLLPFTGRNGTLSILDAWVRQRITDEWSVTAGQFKLPFWREWLVSERFIQPVERSTLAIDFASIYAQGVKASYASGPWSFEAAYSDGLRSLNSPYAGAADGTDTESQQGALTVRTEYLAFGTKADFTDLTSFANTEPGLLLGIAGHWQGETESFFGIEINSLVQGTVDASYEAEGWNAFAAAVARHIEFPGGEGEETDIGLLAQAGVFVTDDVELVGRYTALIPDPDVSADNTFHELLAGANYYIAGHALKLTGDVQYFFDDPSDTSVVGFGPNPGTGLLASDGGQIAVRLQLQFIF